MENFTAYNPTKLHFGKDVCNELGNTAKLYGKNALLMYGKGSVKKYGYYDIVTNQLRSAGINITEYGGIKPNPVVEDVEEAASLGIKAGVDMIIALGGGSVIDSAKITALCIANGEKAWNYMKWRKMPKSSIPLINVLTLAATGTEMNGAAVLQNHETGEKLGFLHELNFPKHSFLDPSFTISVPADYTSWGIVDLIVHALEAYFGKGDSTVTDGIIFAIIRDAIRWGLALLNDLDNYDLRARIMLDATLALNGTTSYGKSEGDWGMHAVGHQLSLLYDTPHGESLSIVCPAWLKLHKDRMPDKILDLGKALFGSDTVEDTIEMTETMFRELGSAIRLSQLGFGPEHKEEIISQMNRNRVSGMVHILNKEDHAKLVELMM